MKSILFFLAITYGTSTWACWQMEGSLAIDGENYKFKQKVEHNKDYSIPLGNFVLNLLIEKKNKQNIYPLVYSLLEKRESKLILISKGKDELTDKKTNEVYAKGEDGQPHSIIQIKLTDI